MSIFFHLILSQDAKRMSLQMPEARYHGEILLVEMPSLEGAEGDHY